MFVIFLFVPLIGICYFVPLFCAVFPKTAIPLIYLTFIQSSREHNFSDFASIGIRENSASDFYINSDFDGTPLGAWHIHPYGDTSFKRSDDSQRNASIGDGSPVFLYLHGVAFNRAYPHRVDVYKILSNLGYHVLTIDYRGFGNSGGYPKGEADIVGDAVSLLRYVQMVAPNSPVFIWGSSLGAGIAGSVIKSINQTGSVKSPHGIVLDAPFNNVLSAAYHSPQGKMMRVVVSLWHLLKHIFASLDITYNSEANFKIATCPILILHSADDAIVPISLGQSLYSTLRKANVDVKFENLGYQGFGHNLNHEYPGVPALLQDFVRRTKLDPKISSQ